MSNNIDQLFHDQLEGFAPEPKPEIWLKIKQQIPSVPVAEPAAGIVNSSWIWYVAATLTIVAGVSLGIYLNSNNSTPSAADTTVAVTSTPTVTNPNTEPQATKSNTQTATASHEVAEYNPNVTQLTELSLSNVNLSLSLEQNLVALINHKGKYLLDIMADSLRLRIVNQPKNGKVVNDKTTGQFKYLPNENFYGVDSFAYVLVFPNGSLSNKAVIKVNVAKQDKAPKDEPTSEVLPPINENEPITKAEDFGVKTVKNTVADIDVKKKFERLML